MPTESRRILFANDELMNAINFFKSPGIPRLTDGVILKASLDPADKDWILIVFRSFNKDEERIVRLNIASIGAVLINYCITLKIPMAKKASKEIKIIDGQLALELFFLH